MITIGTGVCASICHAVISYGVRLRVARSTEKGTCQGLELRDEHQVWLSRFFHINQTIAKEEGPAACNRKMACIIPNVNSGPVDYTSIKSVAIALDVTQSVKDYLDNHPGEYLSQALVMSFVQRSWRLSERHAAGAELVFACCKTSDKRRQVIGVFEFSRRDIGEKFFKLQDSDENNRFIFLARPVDDETWNKYTGRFLEPVLQGQSNPVRYYE